MTEVDPRELILIAMSELY